MGAKDSLAGFVPLDQTTARFSTKQHAMTTTRQAQHSPHVNSSQGMRQGAMPGSVPYATTKEVAIIAWVGAK